MAIQRLSIEAFLQLSQQHPVLDVRSPGEFVHAHIPGAHSLPLFTDEERKVVGTAYKQESREKAIRFGLEYFGPKLLPMVDAVAAVFTKEKHANGPKTVLVHCWRGGMRSAAVAWLLDLYGYRVFTLAGGYKAYRNWVLQQFEQDYNIVIVGGYTGSGKTEVLSELQRTGEAVADLEAMASHKGSAFGNIGMPRQPSQEMFENLLASRLAVLREQQPAVIWMEDESQRIGNANIPTVLFRQMRTKPVLFLDIPFEERLQHIAQEYGALDKDRLADSIERIAKRLGGLETKNAMNYLQEGNITDCFRILLRYYDKWYGKSMQARENWETLVRKITCENCESASNASLLKQIIIKQEITVNG